MTKTIFHAKNLAAMIISAFAINTSAPAIAEPIDRWWNGWGMGVSEYGWSGSDDSNIYITCDSNNNLSLSVAIRGQDPRPGSDVVFKLKGQEVRFWTKENGDIEMESRVSANNLYFLFDELRTGSTMTLEFDGLSKRFPLSGSAKGLGPRLCE